MVGRLVEQQQIRLAGQRAREQDAPAPSARQRGGAGVGRQAQAIEHDFDLLLEPPAVALFELVLQRSRAARAAAGVAALGHRERGVVIVGDEAGEVAEAVGDDVEHRPLVEERRVLRQAADAQAGLRPDAPAVGRHGAADDVQERRLAGAVAADHADALARLDLQARLVEQRQMAVGNRDAVECEEWHETRGTNAGDLDHSSRPRVARARRTRIRRCPFVMC